MHNGDLVSYGFIWNPPEHRNVERNAILLYTVEPKGVHEFTHDLKKNSRKTLEAKIVQSNFNVGSKSLIKVKNAEYTSLMIK